MKPKLWEAEVRSALRLPVQSRQTMQPTSDRHLGRVYAFPLDFPASVLAIGALVQRNENDAYRRTKKKKNIAQEKRRRWQGAISAAVCVYASSVTGSRRC